MTCTTCERCALPHDLCKLIRIVHTVLKHADLNQLTRLKCLCDGCCIFRSQAGFSIWKIGSIVIARPFR